MGFVRPQHLLCFIFACVAVTDSIVVLGLNGNTNLYCGAQTGSVSCAASGLGITAGVMGLVFGILAILWLVVTEIWDSGIVRYIIVIGMFLCATIAFIAGVVNAVNGLFPKYGAAAAFNFILFISAVLTGVFALVARGGGTASSHHTSSIVA
jgi:hypothetical protein